MEKLLCLLFALGAGVAAAVSLWTGKSVLLLRNLGPPIVTREKEPEAYWLAVIVLAVLSLACGWMGLGA